MKCLGLVPPSLGKRKLSDNVSKKSTDSTISLYELEEKKVKQSLDNLKRKKSEIKHYQSDFNLNSISTNSKHLNAKARRMSTIEIPVRIKNGTNLLKAKRKYSLDSSTNLLKSQHETSVLFDTNQKQDLVEIKEDSVPNFPNRIDSINQLNTSLLKSSTNLLHSARSNRSTTTSANQSTSNTKNSNWNFLPKLRKNSSSKPDEKKVRTQIELTQLDIPTVYRHSNAAFERYKSNPEFYLPDGTIRRKYSLPKLSEALEQVKNFKYLRRYSIDLDNHADTSNIFQDNESDENDPTNFDGSNE